MTASPSSSPEKANSRPRSICGGIALLCGVVELCCMAACFLHKDAALSLVAVSFLLALPTLGFALFGFLRGEQPAWPAVAGGVLAPLPVIILLSPGIYERHVQPAVDRLRHTQAHDSSSTIRSAVGRSSSAARARWSAEAQAAVESWLRSDTNGLFTPRFGKFVRLQGSGYVWPPVWNIQGYDYLTLHRTAQFTAGTIPVVIYVTEGAVTAPGQTNVGTPVLDGPVSPAQGAHIRVSHPEVGKGVKAQTKPEIDAARSSRKRMEELDDGIIKRRQFEQAVQRWGDDGMEALATFLKNGTNQLTAICGDFVCFQNEDYPNYQLLTGTQPLESGDHTCICVRVRALFSRGYLPLDVRITEGRALSPPSDSMGTPVIQRMDLHTGATLVVPHPQLCSFEHFQGPDSLKFLVAENEAKLIGTYTLRSPGSASNQPCKLELRADHSLTLSNCPTPGGPQRLVTIPGEWSLSAYRGVKILFQLSVSGGDAVTLRSATCNLVYPPLPGAFRATVRLACADVSGAQMELEFVADKSIPSPFMPRDNPHFVRRKPTGNPPNWNMRVGMNPETGLRAGIYSRPAYGDDDPGVAMGRVHLAEILYQRGALAEAETNALQGLAGLRKRFRNETIYVPNALHTLSQILQAQGRLPEAESALREELALKQRLWQAKDPRVVQTVSNLNQLLRLQGKPAE